MKGVLLLSIIFDACITAYRSNWRVQLAHEASVNVLKYYS